MDVDIYTLLNVKRNSFTIDELKTNYRKLSRSLHPDRGGDERLFKIVTNAFRALMAEARAREGDATHAELKRGYERAADQGVATEGIPRMFAGRNAKDNLKKFNKFFEENRMVNDAEDGYGAQMTTPPGSGDRADVPLPQTYTGGYSRDRFNAVFDTRVAPPTERRLAVYDELGVARLNSSFAMTSLDGRRPDDFSGANGKLEFVDYMKAHSSSRLVDPSQVPERPVYRNFEEYNRARSATQLTFNEDELAGYAVNMERRQRMDGEEARAIRERDEALERYHARMNRLLMMRR